MWCNTTYSALLANTGAVSNWGAARGAAVSNGAMIDVRDAVMVQCVRGVRAVYFSLVYGYRTIVVRGTTYGYEAVGGSSHLYLSVATARQCGTGYIAQLMSSIMADGTNANNNGNGTDYNPAPGAFPGSAQGNHYAVIYAS